MPPFMPGIPRDKKRWHLCGPRGKGPLQKRVVPWGKQGGQLASNVQHGFWQCKRIWPSCPSEWISLSPEVNFCHIKVLESKVTLSALGSHNADT